MSYGYARISLVTAIQFRLNDPRGGTTTARWTVGQIDNAISEAIKLAEPLGYESFVDQLYPATALTDPLGTAIVPGTLQILDVLKVESYYLGKRSLLLPGQWTFTPSYNAFLTLTSTPASGELIRAHVRQLLAPGAITLTLDQAMLEEYTLSVLYERYVVYGGESATLEDTSRAQGHRITGDQRKLTLMQQQYPQIPPSPARPTAVSGP